MLQESENNVRYKAGDIVFATVAPDLKLIVRRYVDRIYYCKEQMHPDSKELVYFERELSADKNN
jgi:hypothetical protein